MFKVIGIPTICFLSLLSQTTMSLSASDSSALALLDFYTGEGSDSHGRTFTSLLAFDDNQLEEEHNFVQYLFPLHQPSSMIIDAPVLTPELALLLSSNPIARDRFLAALLLFRRFLGVTEDTAIIAPGIGIPPFIEPIQALRHQKLSLWLHEGGHNTLRVTRIIRSLRLCGLEAEAISFYQDVSAEGRRAGLGPRTLSYWRRAAEGALFDSMQRDP
jgi:hypothetical protein